jgi:hypothetical protein
MSWPPAAPKELAAASSLAGSATYLVASQLGGFLMAGTPIAGWFMENPPKKNDENSAAWGTQ